MSDRRRQAMDVRVKARRDRVAQARVRRRRRVAASVAVLVLAGIAAAGVAVSPLADITEVEITGVEGERLRQVRDAADLHPGQNVLTADLDAASSRVERIPWVHSAVARRRPPTTVEVAVLVRTPVAVVDTGTGTWLVDAEGVVVAEGGDDRLPLVDAPGSDPPAVGSPVRDPAVRNALDMRSELPEAIRSRVVRYVAPSPKGLRLELENGITVRAGRAERVTEKGQAIALLLERVRLAEEDGAGSSSAGAATGPDPEGARDDGTSDEGAASGQGGVSRYADPDDRQDGEAPGGRRAVEIDVRAPDRPVVVPAEAGAR